MHGRHDLSHLRPAGQARTPPLPAREAARRQGLRLPRDAPRPPSERHHPADRPSRGGIVRAARALPLGGGAFPGLVTRLSPPGRPVRAARRHPLGPAAPGLCRHLHSLPRPRGGIGVLGRPYGRSRRAEGLKPAGSTWPPSPSAGMARGVSVAELPVGTVTLMFTDIEGSTRLLQQLGDRYTDVLAQHDRLLRAAVDAHGGRVVVTQGDAFFVAFGRAADAVTAAVAAQRALAAHRWPDDAEPRVRMGSTPASPCPRAAGTSAWMCTGGRASARPVTAGRCCFPTRCARSPGGRSRRGSGCATWASTG